MAGGDTRIPSCSALGSPKSKYKIPHVEPLGSGSLWQPLPSIPISPFSILYVHEVNSLLLL